MGATLDEHPVHLWNGPGLVILDQPAGRLETEKVAVNAATVGDTKSVRKELSVESAFQAGLWDEYHASRFAEPCRPIRSSVPVQASDPLQEHIDRTEIRDQVVGVDVERLFEGLCSDHHHAARHASLGQRALHGVVKQPAILHGEAAVMQCRVPCRF